jgi:hypothetical protein
MSYHAKSKDLKNNVHMEHFFQIMQMLLLKEFLSQILLEMYTV